MSARAQQIRGAGGPIASVAVVVVNYGTADLAAAAVRSVLAADHGPRAVEVHLVDNASPGGEAERLRGAHAAEGWGERVTLHLEAENHGFGRGNNVVLDALAARSAPPDAVFLLNPDAHLTGPTVDRLAAFLEARPDAAIAGCAIARPDGTRVTAAFRFPSARSEFVSGAAFGPVTRLFGGHVVALPPDIPTGRVDWVSGAAFMARFDALRQVGFFDPDFFLYFEEIDLMHRVAAAGWEIWHVAEEAVVHEAGAATGLQKGQSRSGRLPDYWYDSWRMYFTKRRGRGGAGLVAAARLGGLGLHVAANALRLRGPGDAPVFARDFGRNVLRPLAGRGRG